MSTAPPPDIRAGADGLRRARRVALAAICASAAAWGLGTVLSKAALDTALDPLPLLAVQLTASVAFLGLLVVWRARPPSLRWPVLRSGWAGLLEPGSSYLVGIIGLSMTTAGNAAVIGSAEPVVTAALAWLLLRERLTARTAASMAVVLLGVLLVSAQAATGPGAGALLGDGLVLVGVVFAALYAVASARAVRHLAPLPLALLQHGWALLLVLAVWAAAAATGLSGGVPAALAWETWALATLSGVVNYALPFWLYLIAVQTLPVGLAAQFLALIPVVGVSGGVLFLGEAFGAAQAAGALLVVLALLALARTPAPRRRYRTRTSAHRLERRAGT